MKEIVATLRVVLGGIVKLKVPIPSKEVNYGADIKVVPWPKLTKKVKSAGVVKFYP